METNESLLFMKNYPLKPLNYGVILNLLIYVNLSKTRFHEKSGGMIRTELKLLLL